jgi:putative tricarboxylic transport membrane protein
MKAFDRGSSLFWLLLSVYVCIASLRMGIGSPRNPGMGFLTFGAAGILGILSLALFVQSFFSRNRDGVAPAFSGILWKRLSFVLLAMIGYALSVNSLGYVLSTFLLMFLLFLILKRTWWRWALVSAVLTTLITHYVFSVVLNCQFPRGPFGF